MFQCNKPWQMVLDSSHSWQNIPVSVCDSRQWVFAIGETVVKITTHIIMKKSIFKLSILLLLYGGREKGHSQVENNSIHLEVWHYLDTLSQKDFEKMRSLLLYLFILTVSLEHSVLLYLCRILHHYCHWAINFPFIC